MAEPLRYLVYRTFDGVCTNVILWDGVSDYSPGDGFGLEIVPAGSSAGIGWTRVAAGMWDAPPPLPVEELQPEPPPE